jgi:hypothetical protein
MHKRPRPVCPGDLTNRLFKNLQHELAHKVESALPLALLGRTQNSRKHPSLTELPAWAALKLQVLIVKDAYPQWRGNCGHWVAPATGPSHQGHGLALM